jgi:hypothetical protein
MQRAARERDELRADLRARAERAERGADADRDEIYRLRAATGRGTGTTGTLGRSTRPRAIRPPILDGAVRTRGQRAWP